MRVRMPRTGPTQRHSASLHEPLAGFPTRERPAASRPAPRHARGCELETVIETVDASTTKPGENDLCVRNNCLIEGRISELKDEICRLKKTPKNSSLPPSTQHPHAKPAPPEKPSGKKPGGQPGHLKHSRPLVPTGQCDEVVTFKPEECRRCGKHLSGCDSEPLRHQVYELPVIKPIVTEYQLHRLPAAVAAHRPVPSCHTACRSVKMAPGWWLSRPC